MRAKKAKALRRLAAAQAAKGSGGYVVKAIRRVVFRDQETRKDILGADGKPIGEDRVTIAASGARRIYQSMKRAYRRGEEVMR